MPNKTNDWLDDLLDRHPGESVPSGFAEGLQQRLQSERPSENSASDEVERHETTIHRFAKPILTMAAAALLVSIGFMMGAGQGPDYGVLDIGKGGQTAETDPEIEEIYEMRELLDSWELMSDEDLEMSFRQLTETDSEWLDELLEDPDATDDTGDSEEE